MTFPYGLNPIRTGLLLAAIVMAVAAGFPLPAAAEPLLTLWADSSEPETRQFVHNLSAWWRFRDIPSSDRLAFKHEQNARARLNAVHRGRGSFALVDAAEMAKYGASYSSLAVVAVLWPKQLHAISRNPDLVEISFPVTETINVLPGAEYFQETVLAITNRGLEGPDTANGDESDGAVGNALAAPVNRRDSSASDSTSTDSTSKVEPAFGGDWMGAGEMKFVWLIPPTPGVVAALADEILLFSASAPAARFLDALAQDGNSLRLLPLSAELLDELKLNHPWLVTEGLTRNDYPHLAKDFEVPAVYSVIVARKDLAEPSVRKLLLSLYEYTRQAAQVNPLFLKIDKANLKLFNGIFPMHPVTRKVYDLPLPATNPDAPIQAKRPSRPSNGAFQALKTSRTRS